MLGPHIQTHASSPPFLSQFEDCAALFSTLESLVFAHYVSRKTLVVNGVLKRGLMTAGVNWGAARQPREVRSHVFDLLLELVFVHEEVNATAKGELEAVMKAVLEKLAVCTLECVKQIDTFNHAGALQILVELDFVKHTLARYLSLSANRVFSAVEALLTPFLDRQPNKADGVAAKGNGGGIEEGDDAFAHARRKELLVAAQSSAAIMFECFV